MSPHSSHRPPQTSLRLRIRSFFTRLWFLFLAPFRMIAKPFAAARESLTNEPEDIPIGETLSRALQDPSMVIEHLEALRGHILRSLVALVITVGVSTAFATRILDWLSLPVGGRIALQAIEVTESIGAFMRVSLMSGFALALPYIGFELFAFINPGLKRHERVLLLTTIPFAVLLFLLGMAFAYYVMLPVALPFLLNFMDISTRVRPSNYIQFIVGVMFWIGVAFQFPLIISVMARLGLIQARTLANGWRFAMLGIAILAAAVTPTIDPVNMALVMAPMVALYFLSVGLAALAQRKRASQTPKD